MANFPSHIWVQGEAGPMFAEVWIKSGNSSYEAGVYTTMSTPTVTSLLAEQPFYVAHRCGGGNWPELTAYSARQCVNLGYKSLEVSVMRSSDGVFACSHDWSFKRITGVDIGGIPSNTWADLSVLMARPLETNDTSQPSRPVARVEDIVNVYAHTHVIFLDHKSTSSTSPPGSAEAASMNEFLDYMDSFANSTERFIWKTFVGGYASAVAAAARGYKSWGIYYDAEILDDTHVSKFDVLGLNYNATQAHWDVAKSYGKPVMGHIIASKAGGNMALSRGADGLMVSNVVNVP